MPRKKPYTEVGIQRVKCHVKGCSQRGFAQWQVCADDNVYRPVCIDHDVELNRMTLKWVGDPDVEAKMAAYEDSLILKS
jgi:hypothetical protein